MRRRGGPRIDWRVVCITTALWMFPVLVWVGLIWSVWVVAHHGLGPVTPLKFADYTLSVACLVVAGIEAARYRRTGRSLWAFLYAFLGMGFVLLAFA